MGNVPSHYECDNDLLTYIGTANTILVFLLLLRDHAGPHTQLIKFGKASE